MPGTSSIKPEASRPECSGSGNTTLEKNCLTAGIQAYNYAGQFVGVAVRNNVINIGNSFVPVTSVISGWSTNINSTNCALVPN